MNLRRIGFPCVLVLGLALVLAGCGAASAGKRTAAASVATTVKITRPPPASSKAPPPSTPVPVTVSSSSANSPAAVVQAYFAAIDAEDYEQAWTLGGENFGESYTQFTAGFANTATDTVQILSTSGSTVSVDLTATQTDGTQKQFTGTYTVSGNAITSASIIQAGASSSASTCGAPTNPYGYTFCAVGTRVTRPPSDICTYFTSCIANFRNGRGYMVECNDGTYSMSGGIEDACSYHEGVKRPVYSGG